MADETRTQAPPYKLTAEKQATELKLVINPVNSSADALEASITREIALLKVAAPIEKEALRHACETAAKGAQATAVVARGAMPVPGADGRLIWSKKLSSAGDRSSKVSHYLGRIEKRIVKKDEPVAKLVCETQGTDGKDIYGRALKAPKSKPFKVRCGANVREKEGIFFAEKDGLLRLDNGKLVVDQVFLVEGDLTFEVGNIDFPGSVIVKGGILDLFEVKAGGSVEVDGLVEAARIVAGGDVEIKGGVEGKKKGVIASRGSVSAKFLVNAEVQAAKDVCVETQIITSKVSTLGAVKAPQGAIAGGEVTALGGIEAGTIGSESGVPTVLTAGLHFMLTQITAKADAVIAEGKKKSVAFEKELAGLRTKELTSTARERLTAIEMLKSETTKEMAAAEKKRNDAVTFAHDAARPVIVARTVIHPGVVLRLGNIKSNIGETLRGPLKVVADAKAGTLRFVPIDL